MKKALPYIFLASCLFIVKALFNQWIDGDIIFHYVWFKPFFNDFSGGALYPRWIAEQYAGCGSPVFYFYPPLAYFISSAFAVLYDIKPIGFYPMMAAGFVAVFVGTSFMYKLCRDITSSHEAALGAAILYAIFPINIVTYYRMFSFAEFMSVAIMPALLFFTRKMARDEKYAVAGCAVFYALLIMSNIPVLIAASGLPVLYIAIKSYEAKSFRPLVKMLAAILIAFALAAVYVVPMLKGMEFVRLGNTKELWSNTLSYANNFLYDLVSNMAFVQVVFILSVIATCMMVISIHFYRYIKSGGDKNVINEAMIWLFVVIFSIFMTTPLSEFIWKIVPILQVMQFPKRILIVTTVAFCVLASLFIASVYKKEGKFDVKYFCMCLMVIYAFDYVLIGSIKNDGDRAGLPTKEVEIIEVKQFAFDHNIPQSNHEYLPIWADEGILNRTVEEVEKSKDKNKMLLDVNKAKLLIDKCSQQTRVLAGDAEVSVSKWENGDIGFTVDAKSEAAIEISQFYYPFWELRDEGGKAYQLTPSKKYGLINFRVPAGHNNFTLKLVKSKYEIMGKWISLLALFGLILTVVYERFFVGRTEKVK